MKVGDGLLFKLCQELGEIVVMSVGVNIYPIIDLMMKIGVGRPFFD